MTLHQLQSDVMKRLGELAGSLSSFPVASVPGPEDIIALKVESLLPEIGGKLLREASMEMLGAGVPIAAEVSAMLMPCGLYAAEVRLPDDFVRLTSVSLIGWQRSISRVIVPGDPGWECQWSAEPGIAGSPGRPRGYLDGGLLRLIGTEGEVEVEHIYGWRLPKGLEFEFPELLYSELVKGIALINL